MVDGLVDGVVGERRCCWVEEECVHEGLVLSRLVGLLGSGMDVPRKRWLAVSSFLQRSVMFNASSVWTTCCSVH